MNIILEYKSNDFNLDIIIILLQENNIEGVWSKLKSCTFSFSDLKGNIFNTNRDINDSGYFNRWICTGLFYMSCEHLKLGLTAKKNEIIKYLKIN